MYNNKKSHQTIPGAVCTIICVLLMLWEVSTTFVKYSDHKYVPYSHSRKLKQVENDIYVMDIQHINLISQISSLNTTYNSSASAYFGGVYIQEIIELDSLEITQKYIQAIPCQ